jgi:hypothetical protein
LTSDEFLVVLYLLRLIVLIYSEIRVENKIQNQVGEQNDKHCDEKGVYLKLEIAKVFKIISNQQCIEYEQCRIRDQSDECDASLDVFEKKVGSVDELSFPVLSCLSIGNDDTSIEHDKECTCQNQ